MGREESAKREKERIRKDSEKEEGWQTRGAEEKGKRIRKKEEEYED